MTTRTTPPTLTTLPTPMTTPGATPQHRFYTDLALWWPLVSPPHHYEEEAAFAAGLLRSAAIPVRTLLELGSGGGHNAVHLKREFTITLSDLSDDMLNVSRVLNPKCRHIQGDMRTLRLREQFDAVLLHDAIDYMITEEDLRAALRTARTHLRPGGVLLVMPDHTSETFKPDTDHGGEDGNDGRAIRFMDWSWDPDPFDTWIQTEYAFVLRDADGSVSTVHESHRTGLFSEAKWQHMIRDLGLAVARIVETTAEDRSPRIVFTGHAPR